MATSSVTFFRQMGGTIGSAAFLSILFTTLPNKIARRRAATAAASDPQLAPSPGSSGQAEGRQRRPVRHVLHPEAADVPRAPFKTGFSDSIDLVFLVAAVVVAIGFFVLLFLPQLALRTQSGIQAQAAGDAPAETTEKAMGAAAPHVDAAGERSSGRRRHRRDGAAPRGHHRHEAVDGQPTGVNSIASRPPAPGSRPAARRPALRRPRGPLPAEREGALCVGGHLR